MAINMDTQKLQTATKTVSTRVTEKNCASAIGSGELPVFATPAMSALMEQAAWQAVAPYLDEGDGTVGISMNISHDAPTPIGHTVTATATVTQVDGRKLTFTVEAFDGATCIGKGTHQRFIINNEKFMGKVKK